jgi:5-bromo-4-chloroindolyl phosphate hydrolysis protein
MLEKIKYEGVIRKSEKQDFKKLSGSFWALTTYYNSTGIKEKKKNYQFFRNNLKKQKVKLLTIECAFKKQKFELKKEDADKLIQVRSNSILWQKERLLNIGLDKWKYYPLFRPQFSFLN